MAKEEKTIPRSDSATTTKVLVGLMVLLLAFICITIICCIGFFSLIFGLRYQSALEVVDSVNDICGLNNLELKDVYENKFTDDYKDRVSYLEFKTFYKQNADFFKVCSKDLDETNWKTFINNFSYEFESSGDKQIVNIETRINGDDVTLEVVKEDDSNWKINVLEIE